MWKKYPRKLAHVCDYLCVCVGTHMNACTSEVSGQGLCSGPYSRNKLYKVITKLCLDTSVFQFVK